MSIFSKFIEDIAKDAETFFGRVKDKSTFRRLVSACYLIARADGDFDSDEKSGLAKLVQKHLPHFSIGDILKVLGECEEKIAFDVTMGFQEIMDDIAKASGDDAELIVRACCFIGAADGDFDADEKKVAKAIAVATDLDPSRYGL